MGKTNTISVSNSIIFGNNNVCDQINSNSDLSGGIFVLGRANNVKEINSIVVGDSNLVNILGTKPEGSTGNIVIGKSNQYIAGSNGKQSNMIIGESNIVGNSNFSIVKGRNNRVYGSYLGVCGYENKVGDINNTNNRDYFAN